MMNLKHITLLLGTLLTPAAAAPSPAPRELLADKYIVTLKKDLVSPQVDSHVSWVTNIHRRGLERRAGGIDKVWSKSFKGYSGQFDEQTLKDIRASAEVRFPLLIPPPFLPYNTIYVAQVLTEEGKKGPRRGARGRVGTLLHSDAD